VPQEPEEPSNADWPSRRIAGREAFSSVFRELYEPLVRYASGITKKTEAAEDVVQEVFLKLWTDRDEITIERSLQAFLYTMVRNRALNANRNRKTKAQSTQPEDMDRRRNEEPKPDEEYATEDLRQRISEWIEDLPPRRQEAFVLSRHHGLSHSEIASIMEISKRTVDTHVVHALQDLRRRLDNYRNEGDSP